VIGRISTLLSCIVFAAFVPTQAAFAQTRLLDVQYVPTKRAQIAIWIESADGTFVRTLALTQAVAYRGIGNRPGASQMNSGFRWPYGRREGVLPVWAHRRAAAPGAQRFRRVIFQDRISEGHASRSSSDHSRDDYYCLSFTGGDEELDAVSCASIFNSDKGRFITDADVAAGYHEPVQTRSGAAEHRALDLYSLYPARRDVTRCTGSGCFDHPDVSEFVLDARRVMPDIDAVTMATPPGDAQERLLFTWPNELPDGEYVVYLEINTEGDYNADWGPNQYPTPQNPPGSSDEWDYWALSYGYPYRGQPSVVYSVPFHVGPGADRQQASTPTGYGSLSGFGDGAAEMQAMDSTITDDPTTAPGSGADRLRTENGSRLRVTVLGPEVCEENTAPGAITEMTLAEYPERKHAHRFAVLSFRVPEDDLGISRYEVRVAHLPIVDELSFLAAGRPANAASLDSVALSVPTQAPAGSIVEVELGGLAPETHYWIGMRAVDDCNIAGPISVAEYESPSIHFTTVSPCFVATAAYGTPMADEIGALRRFRDRHLRTNPMGRAFVDAYEEVGPVFADAIRDHEVARAVARGMLDPIVSLVRFIDE
jgi:hypothetical protein